MTPDPRRLIIDCDTGVDDAVALLLAFAAPDLLQLLAVTSVAGNVDATRTARNCRLIREIAGRGEVPVHAGSARPLRHDPVVAEHFHGESGLGALRVFEPAAPLAPGHAVDAIIGHVRREPANSVSIAITGPCTNVAAALLKAPDIAPRLGEVVIMGGARSEGGNITASAEYNIYADPAAADVVLTQAPNVTMLGLDVTHQIRATPERIAALAALGNPRADAAANLLQFSSEAEAAHGIGGGAPLHDPATILWLLAPHLFSGQRAYIRAETESALTRGHTQVDFREKDKTNALWLMHADADGCFAVLMERLAR